jgi:hypothetical protein
MDPAKVFSDAGAVVQAGAAFLGLFAFVAAEFWGMWGIWEIPKSRWIEIGIGVGGATGLGVLAILGVPSSK